MQGLDQEMPGQKFMSPDAITARLGKDITQAAVDESVMRMLTPMFSVGVMDAHDADPTTWSYHKLTHNVTTEDSVKSARKLAAQVRFSQFRDRDESLTQFRDRQLPVHSVAQEHQGCTPPDS